MTEIIPDREKWQAVLRNQKLANARRWLALIEDQDDPAPLVASNYDNFLRALETTLESPETFDLAYQLIQSIYYIAMDYADWDRWLAYLKTALKMSHELGKESENANLLVQEGDIYRRMANLKQAELIYKAALLYYKKLHNKQGFASTLPRLAILYDLQGDMKRGVDLCHQSISIAEDINDKWILAQANLNLSYIYLRARDWQLGIQAAEKAYNFYKSQDDPKFAVKALMNIVAIWAELGKWEKVNLATASLVDKLIASGDIRTLSQLKNNLGFTAFTQANYIAAEATWQEALRLHSQIQEPVELANLYNNLGMVYTKMEEWEAAEEMLHKAVAAHEELGDTYNWANSLDNLADLYEALGKTADCRQVLEKAHAGLQSIADSPHAQNLLTTITQRLSSLSAL